MRPERPGAGDALCRFAALFLALFLAACATYGIWGWTYKRLLVAATNDIVGGFEPPVEVRLLPGGDVRYVERLPGGARSQTVYFEAGGLGFVGVQTLLLPALVLATPLAWRSRLRLTVLAIAALLLLQVVVAVCWAVFGGGIADRPEALSSEWTFRTLSLLGPLGALAIWGALCGGEMLARLSPPPAPHRNDPCRCGSGHKHKHCCGRVQRGARLDRE